MPGIVTRFAAMLQWLTFSRHSTVFAYFAAGEREVPVSWLNALAQQVLFGRSEEWRHAGRPVMVTCNDYDLRLFNGDIGIALAGVEGQEVWFEAEGGDFGVCLSRACPVMKPLLP